MLEDYRNPTYRALARSVITSPTLRNYRVPFALCFDATLIHYKPWTQIVFDPRSKSSWRVILEKYYSSDEYKRLNTAVAGDPLLSKYATVNFLNALVRAVERAAEKTSQLQSSQRRGQTGLEEAIQRIDEFEKQNPAAASRIVREVVEQLVREAREVSGDVEVARAFSHVGVPMAVLGNPDEFREMARNRIVVSLVRMVNRVRREAPSLKSARSPTLVGGRPLGVKRIQRVSEVPRALPTEYLDADLFSYKVATRSLSVSEQYGSVQNYVVYLDKSGSMSEDIEYHQSAFQVERVPKISFAAASALALSWALRRVGARMTLKLFDTEVHEPIRDFLQLVNVLMRVRSDGGTNITKVLEDAVEHHRDDKVVVVTDGIDEVDEGAVKRAKSAGLDVHFVFIQTSNKLLQKYFPYTYLREAKPNVLLTI